MAGLTKTTSHKVVLPFYLYAAVSFLAATTILLLNATAFTGHYFQPRILAITHLMALGWGTMIILGSSHQLVPVLIERKLYSDFLAHVSFALAALGIPMLVYGFYTFQLGWLTACGGILIVASIVTYVVNLAFSIAGKGKENVHAIYVLTAACWLLITAGLGLLLLYNFQYALLSKTSIKYLPLHAHLGIVGWFLLLVIGVGSRLIPMFMISKYSNVKKLRWIYFLLNSGLAGFVLCSFFTEDSILLTFPLLAVGIGIFLFGTYCYRAWQLRIRKGVDEQMKMSLLSVVMMALPILLLTTIIIAMIIGISQETQLALTYGFLIFFGWLTAIILGMTFKTLPFIVWNKIYHHRAAEGKTPNPKEFFSDIIFRIMCIVYLAGFILFATGILLQSELLLHFAAQLLLFTAFLYNWNVMKIITYKPALP